MSNVYVKCCVLYIISVFCVCVCNVFYMNSRWHSHSMLCLNIVCVQLRRHSAGAVAVVLIAWWLFGSELTRYSSVILFHVTGWPVQLMASDVNSEEQSSSSSKPASGPRCCVCGDDASGFHYGVDSCEGCKVISACCSALCWILLLVLTSRLSFDKMLSSCQCTSAVPDDTATCVVYCSAVLWVLSIWTSFCMLTYLFVIAFAVLFFWQW